MYQWRARRAKKYVFPIRYNRWLDSKEEKNWVFIEHYEPIIFSKKTSCWVAVECFIRHYHEFGSKTKNNNKINNEMDTLILGVKLDGYLIQNPATVFAWSLTE